MASIKQILRDLEFRYVGDRLPIIVEDTVISIASTASTIGTHRDLKAWKRLSWYSDGSDHVF